MRCSYCHRKLPNKSFKKKNGFCIWCDYISNLKCEPCENELRKRKGIIAFDFDATMASYKRPFKFDKLGRPQKNIIRVMQFLYDLGYYILIFTNRKKTKKMDKWLKRNKVPYNGFNIQPSHHDLADNYKPYYDVIVDDKAVNIHWKHNKKTIHQLIQEIDKKLGWSKEGKNG